MVGRLQALAVKLWLNCQTNAGNVLDNSTIIAHVGGWLRSLCCKDAVISVIVAVKRMSPQQPRHLNLPEVPRRDNLDMSLRLGGKGTRGLTNTNSFRAYPPPFCCNGMCVQTPFSGRRSSSIKEGASSRQAVLVCMAGTVGRAWPIRELACT